MLADGEQQILAEAPIQESAGARAVVHHLQGGEFADHDQRGGGGGDEAVLGIAVEEDVELVIQTGALRNLAAGQEDFAVRAAVEMKSGRGFAEDGEGIAFAEFCHGKSHPSMG